jgi:hypothetical protein
VVRISKGHDRCVTLLTAAGRPHELVDKVGDQPRGDEASFGWGKGGRAYAGLTVRLRHCGIGSGSGKEQVLPRKRRQNRNEKWERVAKRREDDGRFIAPETTFAQFKFGVVYGCGVTVGFTGTTFTNFKMLVWCLE